MGASNQVGWVDKEYLAALAVRDDLTLIDVDRAFVEAAIAVGQKAALNGNQAKAHRVFRYITSREWM